MIFSPFGFSGAIMLDPDAAAFLRAAGINDYTISLAVNTLVLDLKGFNLWNSFEAIYPFVGGTAETHKWNLKYPLDADLSWRIQFSGGWTHSLTQGIVPNGTNTVGNTFYKRIGADNNFHLSYFTRTNTMDSNTPGMAVFGANTASASAYTLGINRAGGSNLVSIMGNDNQAVVVSFGNVPQQGLAVATRASSTSNKVYLNGTLRGTNTGSNTGTWPNRNVQFGEVTSNVYNKQNCIFASFGNGLTDGQVTNLTTAVNKFQTILGR